jgi:signal transduction histidine kinase
LLPILTTEAQTHVFDRFFRLEGTVVAGSGLGLAIARELAELMDGRIDLESTAGSTTFTIILPPDAFGHPLAPGMRAVDEQSARGSRKIAQV